MSPGYLNPVDIKKSKTIFSPFGFVYLLEG